MSAPLTIPASRPTRSDAIAAVMVMLWACGAGLSRSFGIWPAVGLTASTLGALAVGLEGGALADALDAAPSKLLLGLVVGCAMAAATFALFPPVTAVLPGIRDDVTHLYVAFGRPGLTVILLLLPVVVACEEIVWRGAVHSALATHFGWFGVAILGSILYALAHTPIGSPALVLTCLCVGFCWNVLRSWSGSLAAVIVAHLAWDLAVLVVHPLVAAP